MQGMVATQGGLGENMGCEYLSSGMTLLNIFHGRDKRDSAPG